MENSLATPCSSFALRLRSQRRAASVRCVVKQTRLVAMASKQGEAAAAQDKPNPWRFIRWGKANQRQRTTDKHGEQKKGNFTYKVVPGDTLSDIAKKFNTYVEVIMEANGILNPDNVAAGQLLWIPRSYKILEGDTLYALSRKFGVKMETIQAANGIENPNLIYADDIILIPDEAESPEVGMMK